MSSLLLFGTGSGLFSQKRLDVIDEEDLQDLLEKCEHDHPLQPMAIKTDHDIDDGLPTCIDIILRIFHSLCFCL